jgi:galactokinase
MSDADFLWDIRDETAATFSDAFGYEPSGIWSAPGTVNLLGDSADFDTNLALAFAIDRRAFVCLGLRNDGVARVASSFAGEAVEISLADIAPEQLAGWSAVALGLPWALAQSGSLGASGADLAAVPGFDIYIESDVPAGAGPSAAGAVEAAVALALNDVWQLGLDRRTLARGAQLADAATTGSRSGGSPSVSLLGQPDSAILVDGGNSESRIIRLGMRDAGLAVLLIDAGGDQPNSGDTDHSARASLDAGALGVGSLRDLSIDDLVRARDLLDDVDFRRLRHVVSENGRVLDAVSILETEGPAPLGDLLDASHRSLRDDLDVSELELDLAVETARAGGALGARALRGGSAIALVALEDVSRIQVAIDGAFAEHGVSVPESYVVTPSPGALRER